MKLSRRQEPSGLIITQFGGRHTYEDATGALDEMLEMTRGSKEIYEIVIHSDDLHPEMSKEQIDVVRDRLRQTLNGYDRGAIAFVSTKDLIFGLCRQLEMTIDNVNIAVSVFRSEELAQSWIREVKLLHAASP